MEATQQQETQQQEEVKTLEKITTKYGIEIQPRNVFKLSLKNQHLLAFAYSLLQSEEALQEVCLKKGLDLSAPVTEQNEFLETAFWNDAKQFRKSLNQMIRKKILKIGEKKNKNADETRVKRKYTKKEKNVQSEENVESQEQVTKPKRKYTKKEKVVAESENKDSTNVESSQDETKPKRKYTKKEKKVELEVKGEQLEVEEQVSNDDVKDEITNEIQEPNETKPKRKYTKKEKNVENVENKVDEVNEVTSKDEEPVKDDSKGKRKNTKKEEASSVPHPFDKFKTKLNKKIKEGSVEGSIQEQKESIREIIQLFFNTDKNSKSCQEVYHLVRTSPQFVALLTEDDRIVVGDMTAEPLTDSYLHIVSADDSKFMVELV